MAIHPRRTDLTIIITHPPCRHAQVSTVLSNMVQTLIEVPSVRLLKHIVRCYLRLSENPRCVRA